MEPPRDVSGVLPNLLVLFLFAIGIMSTRAPLDTARPQMDAVDATEHGPTLARLWEDPFGIPPSLSSRRAETAGPAESAKPLNRFVERAARAKARDWRQRHGDVAPPALRVLVLPVLLDGDPYAETVETRLRTRYAVVSALGRAQYLPTDLERIRFLRLAWGTVVPSAVATREKEQPADVRATLLAAIQAMAGTTPPSPPAEVLEIPYEIFEMRALVTDDVVMARPPLDPDLVNENYWRETDADHPRPQVRITDPYDRVIVLWLDENDLRRVEYRLLRESQQAGALAARAIDRVLKACINPAALATEAICDLKIIGPTGSDALLGFLNAPDPPQRGEGEHGDAVGPASFAPLFREAEILCPRATVADAVLQISSTYAPDFWTFDVANQLVAAPPGPAWRVSRTVATDDRLLDVLLSELRLRQAAPSETPTGNHMVIVGEWETLYARGLGRTLSARLAADGNPARAGRATWSRPVTHLHEYSYLRGLDGRLPRRPDSAVEDTTSDSDRRQSAAGPSQVDYLRRLAGEIRTLQNDLQRRHEGRITSIGVVGSDVYDKLLVLRALRESFPDVIFFTTDADALYFEPSESRWTQNLLVVSSYGLSAQTTLQGRIPPFRDSYQTATFLTVLRALHVTSVGVRRFALESGEIVPRVFELGRLGPIDLSPPEIGENAPLHRERPESAWKRWNSLQGALFFGAACVVAWVLARIFLDLKVGTAWPWLQFGEDARGTFGRFLFGALWVTSFSGLVVGLRRFSLLEMAPGFLPGLPLVPVVAGAALVAVVAGMGVLYQFAAAQDGQRGVPRMDWPRWLFGVQVAAGVVVLALAWRALAVSDVEEPFAWFQGVSVWPTEILRAAAMLMTVGFVVSALRRLRECDARTLEILARLVRRRAGARGFAAEGGAPDPKIGWTHEAWRELFLRIGSAGQAAPTLADLAAKCARASLCRRRFVRVVLYLVLHVFVFATLMALLGPPTVPVRGAWSLSLDTGFLVGSVLPYLLLLVLVFDAIVISHRFIRLLVRSYRAGEPGEGGHREVFEIVRDQAETNARLVYLPFSVLFLLIVSRASLFDTWSWPIPLIIVLGAGLCLIVVAAIILSTVTRGAKEAILQNIRADLDTLDTTAEPEQVRADPPRADREQLEKCRSAIDACTSQVFQGLHQMPLVRAVLFTLGGVGSLQVLEKLAPLLP